jgi:hypothetical protein
MEYLNIVIVVICLAGIAFCMLVRRKRRLKREQAIQKQRDAHLAMLNEGIERLAQQNPDAVFPQLTQSESTSAREMWGYPPQRDQWFEEILTRDEIGGEWDYAIHVHEAAEQYLGSEEFFRLRERFASVPGVDECIHEDREVFLVRTQSLDAQDILDAFWSQFLKAAATGAVN